MKKILFIFLVATFFFSCKNKIQESASVSNKDSIIVNTPAFDADSAYHYIKTQVDFGPRIPNSKAHEACGDYLIKEMKRFGATVTVQSVDLKAWDGKTLKARNIIGAYNTDRKARVLLLSHWDCRPWSDNDPNPANHNKPVDGANDGASGVGVLMEIARQMQQQTPEVGIDILFVDMEDYGSESNEDSWCLGTQYWAQNPHVPGYRAQYAILLDMVGAPNATFPKEGFSMQYASNIVEKVWKEAQKNGFEQYFINKQGSFITDDHVSLIKIAGIPTIDIIHLTENGFGSYWHTQDDTMKNIDKNTLKAVGTTLLNIIYKEKE